MNKSKVIAEHGRDSVYGVILHGYIKLRDGGFPSMAFDGTKDPRAALSRAYRMLRESTDASPLPKEVDERIAAFIRPEKRKEPARIKTERSAKIKAKAIMVADDMKPRPLTIVLGNTVSMEAAKAWAEGEFPGRALGYLRKKSPKKHVMDTGDPNMKYFDPTKKNGKAAAGKDEQTGLPKRTASPIHALNHEAHTMGIA